MPKETPGGVGAEDLRRTGRGQRVPVTPQLLAARAVLAQEGDVTHRRSVTDGDIDAPLPDLAPSASIGVAVTGGRTMTADACVTRGASTDRAEA